MYILLPEKVTGNPQSRHKKPNILGDKSKVKTNIHKNLILRHHKILKFRKY